MNIQETKDLAQIVNVLSNQHKICRIILFGSRAKETHRPSSDWDIALKGESITLEDIVSFQNALEDLWLPNQIDLVIYDTIENHAFKEHIDRVGREVWSK